MPVKDHKWSEEDASFIKAVWDGKADEHIQRRTIQIIVEKLCRINQITLEPGHPDVSAFNAGAQWVGRQLQTAITTPINELGKDQPNEPDRRRVPTATERAASNNAGGGRRG